MADMFQQFNEQMTTTPLARKIALLLILAATVAGGSSSGFGCKNRSFKSSIPTSLRRTPLPWWPS